MNTPVSKVPPLTPAQLAANQQLQDQLRAARPEVRMPGRVQYAWRVIDDLRGTLATLPVTHPNALRIRRQISEWLESVGEYDLAATVHPERAERSRLRKKQKLHDACEDPIFEMTDNGLHQNVYREKDLAHGFRLRCSKCSRRWHVAVLPKELANLSAVRAQSVKTGQPSPVGKDLADRILK